MIGYAGYVVTFKQVDSLYTLDLRASAQPKAVGELELPGYSSLSRGVERSGRVKRPLPTSPAPILTHASRRTRHPPRLPSSSPFAMAIVKIIRLAIDRPRRE
jgi:Beta propeller domain